MQCDTAPKLPPTPTMQTDLQYGYSTRLGDNRGITFGFCGFTTGTDDGLTVRPPAADAEGGQGKQG